MTSLQQMAFERITTLNKECQQRIPKRFSVTDSTVEISVDTLHALLDALYEQENFIESLWDEERRDGCEEIL